MNLELVVVVFEHQDKASTALKALEQLESQGDIALSNGATLVHSAEGEVTVKETHDWEPQRGAFFGILIGGMVGAAMGPAGALIGAAMAGTGGAVIATLVDIGFPNKYLGQVQTLLPPGHSALVVLVRTIWLKRLLTELSQQDGELLHWTLQGDFEEALNTTLPEIREQVGSLWSKHAAKREAASEKLEAQLAALDQEIKSTNLLLVDAKGTAQEVLRSQLDDLRANQAILLGKLQALYEAELQTWRLAIDKITAETVLAGLQGQATSSNEIESLEAKRDASLQKLGANLEAQASVAETRIQALHLEGVPESMWALAHWNRQIRRLQEEREAVHEQHRLNLVEQRGALDRTMRRRIAEGKGLRGESRRAHEIEFEAMGDRRGELLRKLGMMSFEGTQA